MYYEKDYSTEAGQQSHELKDDCLAVLGLAMMLSQLSA